MTANQLTFFTVVGHWYDVEAPATSGTTNTPGFQVVSAFVTFTARLKPGTVINVADLDLRQLLGAPPGLTVTPSATGGAFTGGTYFWVVTTTTPDGESTRSTEVSTSLTGTTASATLSWQHVPGAAGYKIYRGTAANTENKLIATLTDVNTTTYTDTGTAGTTATPPSTNTAELSANTAIPLAPVTARILNGELEVINQADTANVQLLANTAITGLPSLIYDVSFTNVVYAGAAQVLSNFAFTAPTSAVTVDLADPALTRLPYNPSDY